MPLEVWPLFLNTLYKIASLGVGFLCIYLGFRLFMAGIWGPSGDMSLKYRENSLVLKSAAPGTFFALFGAIIVGFTIWKGLDLKYSTAVKSAGQSGEWEEHSLSEASGIQAEDPTPPKAVVKHSTIVLQEQAPPSEKTPAHE